jgi:signal transduction histidine kinase
MPLFEAFSDEQLLWLSEHGTVVRYDGGERVFSEGDPNEAFYVLIEGELQISKLVGGHELIVTSSDQPGVWAGQAWDPGASAEIATVRALRPSRLFRVPAASIRHMVGAGFPIVTHLLAGMTTGTRRFEAQVGQFEKLQALGKLAAGLAHELNNPAAAAGRATAQLREALREQQAAVVDLAAGGCGRHLEQLEHEVAARCSTRAPLGTLERGDREDEVAAWLDARGIARGWEVAPTLVDVGIDTRWLEQAANRLAVGSLAPMVRWVAATSTTTRLLQELEHSVGRVSDLVQAVKSYSYMDQAPLQDVDVHEGLESTLTMLGHRLHGIHVERGYAAGLPRIQAYGSELNQVWTNLIDNAVDALDGRGRITIRTAVEGDDHVVVEVADDGPGIPTEIRTRIFEPFFTTKDVGEGTGLGLDIVYRVVVQTHGGSVDVTSEPGRTAFRVRLPAHPRRPSEG